MDDDLEIPMNPKATAEGEKHVALAPPRPEVPIACYLNPKFWEGASRIAHEAGMNAEVLTAIDELVEATRSGTTDLTHLPAYHLWMGQRTRPPPVPTVGFE